MIDTRRTTESRTLTLGSGIRVNCLVSGRGDRSARLVFVHGNPGSTEDWHSVLSALREQADVAVVDLPGFGRSPRPERVAGALSLDRLAATVLEIPSTLGWRSPVVIVGHSHGAAVAVTAASLRPDLVSGVVALSSLGFPAHPAYRALGIPGLSRAAAVLAGSFRYPQLRGLHRAVLGRVLANAFHPQLVPQSRVDRQLEALMDTPSLFLSMFEMASGDPSARLLDAARSLRVPALFLHGARDALVPASHARAVVSAILAGGGSVEMRLVEDGGHMLMDSHTSLVARAVEDIVARAAGRAA